MLYHSTASVFADPLKWVATWLLLTWARLTARPDWLDSSRSLLFVMLLVSVEIRQNRRAFVVRL